MPRASFDERSKQLLSYVRAGAKRCSSWIELNNEVFSPGGKLLELFPTREERTKLLKTPIHAEIRKIIDALPEPPATKAPAEDFSGRILVRLPKSVHASLAQEAQLEGVSLNQLIVAKLSVQLAAVV
jgi:predicted HicB family RNase H-like nuclease